MKFNINNCIPMINNCLSFLFFYFRDAGNIKTGLEHLVSSNFLLNICIIFDICILNEQFWMSFESLELKKSTISQRVSLLLLCVKHLHFHLSYVSRDFNFLNFLMKWNKMGYNPWLDDCLNYKLKVVLHWDFLGGISRYENNKLLFWNTHSYIAYTFH